MRQGITGSTFTSCTFTGLALLGTVMTAGLRADDQIDKKVVEIVKQTGELYKNAKSFHVEGRYRQQSREWQRKARHQGEGSLRY